MNKNNFRVLALEYIVPIIASISLLISCVIISQKKYFWNDELYSYYFLADSSFTKMVVAFHDKINNTPPLYFILGWLWARVFGSTELSLRLFSSLGICIACVTVWITLRRTYNFWSASIGTLAVFCTSDIILSQNAEARMYGLFLAACSLALLVFDIFNRTLKLSWIVLLFNFFIHAAIVQTHLFGLFYSGAVLFSQLVRDKCLNIFRPKIYLSIILSWLTLILYIPAFINQSDAGKPRTWIPIPTSEDLLNLMNLSSSSFLNLFVLLLLVLIFGLFFLGETDNTPVFQVEQQNTINIKVEKSLLILAYAFLAVPIFVWMFSRTVKPIFWDRYMIPTTLSWAILLASLCSRIISMPTLNNKIYNNLTRLRFLVFTPKNILLLVLCTILLMHPIKYAKIYKGRYLPGLNDNKYGYKELPIVVQASGQFLERVHYSPERNKYFFILDWQAAVDDASGQFSPQEYKHLDAIKRNYPKLFQNQILQSQDFLNKYKKFLVLDYLDYKKKCPLKAKGPKWDDIHCPQWLEKRILSNPAYQVKYLGANYGESLLLVEDKKN